MREITIPTQVMDYVFSVIQDDVITQQRALWDTIVDLPLDPNTGTDWAGVLTEWHEQQDSRSYVRAIEHIKELAEEQWNCWELDQCVVCDMDGVWVNPLGQCKQCEEKVGVL